MYRKAYRGRDQQALKEFSLPFGGYLRTDNRWVRKAEQIPWDFIEDIYEKSFKNESPDGRPPLSARIAFGSILIKETERLTDVGTVDFISENPYAQYFLGLLEFKTEHLFDSSMMTIFRKRFSPEDMSAINEEMFRRAKLSKPTSDEVGSGNDSGSGWKPETLESEPRTPKSKSQEVETPMAPEPESETKSAEGDSEQSEKSEQQNKNRGTLVLDATVAPADVRYPTDVSLLNECRENVEAMIDKIWDQTSRTGHKTSYSRKKARKSYLSIAKQRKPRGKKLRKAIESQLDYLRRALESIDKLLAEIGKDALIKKDQERLANIRIILKQQTDHFSDPKKSIPNRIVNIRQPHVRPIVRGKANAPVEFGQKLAFSIVDGYTFIDVQSFNNFNEGITLTASAEKYKDRHGCYPEAILADAIYRNRDNRAFCKKHGIRLSGPRLGRPKADVTDDLDQAYKDSCARNIVESRNGISKRRYGLNRIMSVLPDTALTEAALIVFAMNVSFLLMLLRVLNNFANIQIIVRKFKNTSICFSAGPNYTRLTARRI